MAKRAYAQRTKVAKPQKPKVKKQPSAVDMIPNIDFDAPDTSQEKILQLQRTIGNKNTIQFLQREPDDDSNTPDTQQSDDSDNLKKGDEGEINKQDIQYEMLAHYVAYQGTGGAMGDLLEKWGYERNWRRTEQGDGFFVGLLMPQQGRDDLTPVLTFKGTDPSSSEDLLADLDPVAVGFSAFQRHKSAVADLISEAGGKVDVVGHSLGGALAQHCAFSFNSSVSRVVTYQSAAISATQMVMLRTMKDQPEATHHVAKGDVVPSGGLGHLKGEGFYHDTGEGAMGAHTAYLFTAPEFKSDREQFGLTDEVLKELGLGDQVRTEQHDTVKKTDGHPTNFLKRMGGELGRQLGSAILTLPLFIASLFQKYPSIPMQDSTVKNNAKHDAVPIFQSYKESATSSSWFGLKGPEGITVSGIEKAVAQIMGKDPAYAKFAGAAEGIQEAAIEVLGIKSITIEGNKVTSISL